MIKKFDYDEYLKKSEKEYLAMTPKQKRKEIQFLKNMPNLGFGKTYPWSVLKKCKCGNKHPWLDGLRPFEEVIDKNANYSVVCRRCLRHTSNSSYHEVVKEWNEMN